MSFDFSVVHYSEGEDTRSAVIWGKSPTDAVNKYSKDHVSVADGDRLMVSRVASGGKWVTFEGVVSLKEVTK